MIAFSIVYMTFHIFYFDYLFNKFFLFNLKCFSLKYYYKNQIINIEYLEYLYICQIIWMLNGQVLIKDSNMMMGNDGSFCQQLIP